MHPSSAGNPSSSLHQSHSLIFLRSLQENSVSPQRDATPWLSIHRTLSFWIRSIQPFLNTMPAINISVLKRGWRDTYIWKTCLHCPVRMGQSSPGMLQSGQHPSKGTRQIPHTSSLGTFHFHIATAFTRLILIFILRTTFFVPWIRNVRHDASRLLFYASYRDYVVFWCVSIFRFNRKFGPSLKH